MSTATAIQPGSAVRRAAHPIDTLFIDRWSPRAMTGEAISEEELLSLFEAARWAPSSYNNQPWRMIYARRDTPAWDGLFNLMIDFNQSWTKNAGALVLFISKKTFDHNGKPCQTHSFDTGAAWANFALQGWKMGLVVHGMEGFDYGRAKKELNIPDDYHVEALMAVGRHGDPSQLPDAMREKEKPNDRRPVEKTAFEGKFRG
jgi:nitroreductase